MYVKSACIEVNIFMNYQYTRSPDKTELFSTKTYVVGINKNGLNE